MATLFVAATPIGNLSDATERLKNTLRKCSLIAAEDTRVTRRLMAAFGIATPLISCYQHNEKSRARFIVERMLSENIDVAYVTDAGTPGISDPGYALVDVAWAAGIRVEPIPGACAVAAILSACGYDAREFGFWGFLPREKAYLCKKLVEICNSGMSVAVIYESPHRVIALLQYIMDILPRAKVCCACDLTKLYEHIDRGSASDVLLALKANPSVEKGEYCLALDLTDQPKIEQSPKIDEAAALILRVMDGVTPGDAVRQLSAEGYAKNALYKARLRLEKFAQTMLEEEEDV